MFKTVRHIFRAIYITYIIRKNKKDIARGFEKLGSAYIKLGQFLSTRADLVGEETAQKLGYLRDKLPAFEFSKVREIIESDLGKTIDQIFQNFEEIPIAAASVAQVHKAQTIEGKEVAVKVLRPNIEKDFKEEIEFFRFIIKFVEKIFPKYKRLKLESAISNIERSFKLESDFAFEAAAVEEAYEKNTLAFVRIPKVDWRRTSRRIITLEWIDAIPISNKELLVERGIDLNKLTKNFVEMFFNQAFSNGFFHADLHQGNVLVDKDGNIVLVDFGIMGRLDYNNRIYVAKIFYGFLIKDYEMVAKIHHEAGYLNSKYNVAQFAQTCRAIGETILNLPPQEMSIAKLLKQLFSITENFEMEIQPQLLLLQKTMLMVEGVGKSLCRDVNLWYLIEDSIKKWADENLSIEAKVNLAGKKIFNKILTKLEELMSSIEVDKT